MKMAWVKVVERKGQSVLISSYFYNGIQAKYFKKALNFNQGFNRYLTVKYTNYYDCRDAEKFRQEIKKILDKTNFSFIRKFFKVFYSRGANLIKLSRKINKLNEKNLNKNMLSLFQKFSGQCLEYGPSMYLPILIDDIMENKIREIVSHHIKKDEQKYTELFTSSLKPTEGTNELLGLYKIARKLNQGRKHEIKKDVKIHLKRFGWLSYTKFVGEPWTEESIIERAMRLKGKDLQHEISELKNKYKENMGETKKAIKEYNIPKKEADIIWLAKELAYFRTYRIDVYTKSGFNIKPLFEVISKRLSINPEDLIFLTYKEIIDFIKNNKKPSLDIIRKRRHGKWQLKFDNGKMEFKYDNFDIKDVNLENITEIKGSPAFHGRVTGNAKIIRGVLEFYKMNEGDILVTSMTTPDFVPLMEKSKAIITDEGGITCHAAIVAREMKKPCIIATKIATKVLKDNDFIEVDANKGIVRKIKQ